jgi:protein dithiol:quinone oxidoreductase
MPKTSYLLVSLVCFCLLGVALFLQHVGFNGVHYPPCPLCILQRIGFLFVGLSCLFAFFITKARISFHLFALLASLFGLIIALRHAYVIAYPEISCGLDPLEVFINQFEIVQALPFFFKADGFCSMPLPPIFGLSVPNWSLIWFLFLLVLFGYSLFNRKKTY